MTNSTISTSLSTGITLSAGGAYASPLTITSTGAVVSPGGDAILSVAPATISNAGLVSGAQIGIFLDTTGQVFNAGGLTGAEIGLAALGYADLTNTGSISGTVPTLVTVGSDIFAGIGVDLVGGGNVTNQLGGVISGAEFGVGFFNTSSAISEVDNSGLIKSTGTTFVIGGEIDGAAGLFLADGGTVTNQLTGTIAGYGAGMLSFIDLGPAGELARNNSVATSVVNAGLIEGGDTGVTFVNGTVYSSSGGVVLNGGGALTNEATGRISGHFGVYLNGGSNSIVNSLDNLGTITGVSNFGVFLGENASMSNSGHVVGFYAGVALLAANNVTNAAGGTITGRLTGIYAVNGASLASTVSNTGVIDGANYGVFLKDGGGVTNATDGRISSTNQGVKLGASGDITNAGTIIGAGVGLLGVAGAVVSLDNTGTIESTAKSSSGVALDGDASILNTGLITGYYGFDNAASANSTTIVNQGTISGTNVALGLNETFARGMGLLENAGLIDSSGTNFVDGGNTFTVTAVLVQAGATVNNEAGGTITAPGFALGAFNGTGTVAIANAGLISGAEGAILTNASVAVSLYNSGVIESNGAYNGVGLGGGGAVTNAAGGTIFGYLGVNIYNAPASVINFGYISGAANDAIYLGGGGAVTNFGTLHTKPYTITGANAADGIQIDNGGSATNASSGRITGGSGVFFKQTGYFDNQGTIAVAAQGFYADSLASVINTGLIVATSSSFVYAGETYVSQGAGLGGPGAITNLGTIEAGGAGINAYGLATIFNSGKVEATGTSLISGHTTFAGSFSIIPAGIDLLGGGAITNTVSGLISGIGGILVGTHTSSTPEISNVGAIAGVNFGIGGYTSFGVTNTGFITASGAGALNQSGQTFAASAIAMFGGGQITNAATGTISGFASGIAGTSAAGIGVTLDNSGLIDATASVPLAIGHYTIEGLAVDLAAGGAVLNQSTGTISGIENGLVLTGGPGRSASLDNRGLIEATGTTFVAGVTEFYPNGLNLTAGGAVTNEAGAKILGVSAVYLGGGADSLAVDFNNAGTVDGSLAGLVLGNSANIQNSGQIFGEKYGISALTNATGLTVTNQSGGTITGSHFGIISQAGGLVENTGEILATGSMFQFGTFTVSATAVDLSANGTFTNQAGGNVSGYTGAYFSADGLLSNACTITGRDGTAAYFGGTASSRVELAPGGVFNGLVFENAFNGVLELGSAAETGTISGLGAYFGVGNTSEAFLGFANITLDSGANWLFAGTDILDAGQTLSDFGTLTVADTFTNNGLILTDPSTITFDSAVTGTGTIDIGANSDVVFNGSVASTETIVFLGTTGTLTLNDPAEFNAAIIGHGTEDVACFLEGTHIATTNGPVPVEQLSIGDILPTRHGGPQKIKWIGARAYAAPFANNPKILPIRIAAGAIARGIPARDLLVSPGHAICLNNALIHAGRLLNGTTITQLESVEHITYYHIELETHEIILAENCPVETFMGEVFRNQFHNAASFAERYPGAHAPERPALPCLASGFQLEATLRRRHAPAKSGALHGYIDQLTPTLISGWACDTASPQNAIILDVLAGNRRIGRVIANLHRPDVAAAGFGAYHGFEFLLPPNTQGAITLRHAGHPWTTQTARLAG